MIKIGIVVQRYGKEVIGGAETLARNIAERLNSTGFDVDVFTTTAKDYISWENYYPEGKSILKGVNIFRHLVDVPRNIEEFNRFSEAFFKETSERDEDKWIKLQGPYCPELIKTISGNQHKYDIFLFFTYLYFTTVKGILVIKKPCLIFPTAHDELPIYLKIMQNVFNKPVKLFFLTEAERNFVQKLFNLQPDKLVLSRTGVEIKEQVPQVKFRNKYMQFAPYILYAGRIEKGKGLELIFNAYKNLKKKRLIDLVLIGKKLMEIPDIEGIKYMGYVSEEMKLSAFKGAIASMQPSALESLSITTLESFTQYTPVLVNKNSQVLMEHINYSEGGLAYGNEEEWITNCIKLNDSFNMQKKMGLSGYRYVKEFYSWEKVIKKIQAEIFKIIKKT